MSLFKKIVLSNSKFSAAALNSISGTSGGKDIGYIRQQHHQVVAVTLTLYISCARLPTPTQPPPPHILTSKQHRQQQRLQQQQQLQHQQLLWSSVHWVPAAAAPVLGSGKVPAAVTAVAAVAEAAAAAATVHVHLNHRLCHRH